MPRIPEPRTAAAMVGELKSFGTQVDADIVARPVGPPYVAVWIRGLNDPSGTIKPSLYADLFVDPDDGYVLNPLGDRPILHCLTWSDVLVALNLRDGPMPSPFRRRPRNNSPIAEPLRLALAHAVVAIRALNGEEAYTALIRDLLRLADDDASFRITRAAQAISDAEWEDVQATVVGMQLDCGRNHLPALIFAVKSSRPPTISRPAAGGAA